MATDFLSDIFLKQLLKLFPGLLQRPDLTLAHQLLHVLPTFRERLMAAKERFPMLHMVKGHEQPLGQLPREGIFGVIQIDHVPTFDMGHTLRRSQAVQSRLEEMGFAYPP